MAGNVAQPEKIEDADPAGDCLSRGPRLR